MQPAGDCSYGPHDINGRPKLGQLLWRSNATVLACMEATCLLAYLEIVHWLHQKNSLWK